MFRNLYNRDGETQARDLTGGAKEEVKVIDTPKASPMVTAMSSSRNLDARRRLSQSARAQLPLLADA